MSFKDLRIELIEGEEADQMLEHFPAYDEGYIKIGEKKWYLTQHYLNKGEKAYNFEVRPDDTWIIAYPRSGVTFSQELIWLVANDMNFDEAHQNPLVKRVPFLDKGLMLNSKCAPEESLEKVFLNDTLLNFIRGLPSPRFIKTHFPLDLLPTVVNSDCKIIYVARNPKDVVVSWYNFQKDHESITYKGNFEQFCNYFMNDQLIWSPYWEHLKEAWSQKDRPNTLFLFYEDLRKDLVGNIKKVSAFYGKTYTDEQIANLVNHLHIDNFRKNPMVNMPMLNSFMKPERFIRQGKVGSWKDMFTSEMEEKFNKWIAENMKDTDLVFPN